MKKTRAIALLRHSTNAQDNARQRADIERLKKRFDLEIVETIELDGVSGRKVLKDPRFLHLLDDLRRRADIDGLALSAIDRFFRTDRYDDTRCFQPLADARKLIWSKVEGEVAPWTPEGFNVCMTAALKSGAEWRTLRDRTMDGKEALRLEGKHVDGPCLPRGVAYDKATESYSYQEPDCSRIVRMCELLLAGDSFHTIAAKVGGVTYNGVRKTLRNPIWGYGTRVYAANSYREEAYEIQVIDKPLIPVATWELVQKELDRRKTTWRKTKQPPRFLLSSLLKCSCGKPWYLHVGSKSKPRSYYYCSTQFRGRGPSCGSPSVRQTAADAAVAKMAGERFTDLKVLAVMLNGIAEPPAPAQSSAKEVARLEGKRERILEQRADGHITRENCNQQIAAIDRELQAARATVAVPAPVINVKRLAAALVRVFAGFHKKPFEFQRDLLREAVRDIVVDNKAITRFTFRGGFLESILGNDPNLLTHCSRWSTQCCSNRCRFPSLTVW
jgi:Resolvase, N terminal domain/Recombinase zinc beta ribbon domain